MLNEFETTKQFNDSIDYDSKLALLNSYNQKKNELIMLLDLTTSQINQIENELRNLNLKRNNKKDNKPL